MPSAAAFFGCLLSGVSLIDIGNFYRFPRNLLNLPLRVPALVFGLAHWQESPAVLTNDPRYRLRSGRKLPFLRLPPSYPARPPLSGVDCKVRRSIITAVGCSFRPSATLNQALRSSTIASNTPALSHR